MRRARKNPQLMFEPYTLESLEEEAIQYIRDHEPSGGYQVGFSGGKDSIVTLDLVKRSGVKYEAHCSLVPGNDNPMVLQFIRKNYKEVPLINIAGKGKNFFSEIEKRGLPFRVSRWCCAVFKESYGENVLTGIRAEESARRANRPRTDALPKGKVMFKPIFRWKEWAVWEYIEKYNLPYPKLYDNGYDRIGCVVCPFAIGKSKKSAERVLISMRQYPTVWRAVKKSFAVYFERKPRKNTTQEMWEYFLSGGGNGKFFDLYPDGVPI